MTKEAISVIDEAANVYYAKIGAGIKGKMINVSGVSMHDLRCLFEQAVVPAIEKARGLDRRGRTDNRKHFYAQGVMNDGAAILKDGQPMTPEEIISALNKE
jgi:hypothetical protein